MWMTNHPPTTWCVMAAVLSDDQPKGLEERENQPSPKVNKAQPSLRSKARGSKAKGPSGLTHKQEQFAKGLSIGQSQAAAYRAAYDTEGMSDGCVMSEASRLAGNPLISARVDSLKAMQARLDWQDMNKMRALALETLATEAQGLGPDTKTSARVAAAVAIGKIAEVDLFADHKVIEHVDHRQIQALTTKLEQRLTALLNKAQSSPNQALTRLEHQPEPEKAPEGSVGPLPTRDPPPE